LVESLALELDELQNLFYADKRYKLLVILQGTDTSGKDGTIRGVFGRMSALGVHTVGWKAPNEAERAHDYSGASTSRCRRRATSPSSTAATTRTCWCPWSTAGSRRAAAPALWPYQ
jgi:polyphosphate kinase 2 (PPK2 family)